MLRLSAKRCRSPSRTKHAEIEKENAMRRMFDNTLAQQGIVVLFMLLVNTSAYSSTTPLDSVVETYLAEDAGSNRNTLKAYCHDLTHLCDFLQQRDEAPTLKSLTKTNFVEYLGYRAAIDAPSTLKRRLDAIKRFCECVSKRCPGFVNTAESLRVPRAPAPEWKGLDETEIEQARCRIADIKNPMRRAKAGFVFELYKNTGLRNDEGRNLVAGNISPCRYHLHGVKRKASVQNIAMNETLRLALAEWLPHWETILAKHDPKYILARDRFPLILSTYGAVQGEPLTYRMNNRTIYTLVKKTTGRNPHALRHTFARDLITKGVLLTDITQLMDHHAPYVTYRYLGMSEQDRQDAVRRLDV